MDFTLFTLAALACTLVQVFAWYKETFDWPRMVEGLLGLGQTDAERAQPLALSQGLYNLFLAAGIGLPALGLIGSAGSDLHVLMIVCMLVAGVFGFLTVHHPTEPSVARRKPFLIQAAVPAVTLVVLAIWPPAA